MRQALSPSFLSRNKKRHFSNVLRPDFLGSHLSKPFRVHPRCIMQRRRRRRLFRSFFPFPRTHKKDKMVLESIRRRTLSLSAPSSSSLSHSIAESCDFISQTFSYAFAYFRAKKICIRGKRARLFGGRKNWLFSPIESLGFIGRTHAIFCSHTIEKKVSEFGRILRRRESAL